MKDFHTIVAMNFFRTEMCNQLLNQGNKNSNHVHIISVHCKLLSLEYLWVLILTVKIISINI